MMMPFRSRYFGDDGNTSKATWSGPYSAGGDVVYFNVIFADDYIGPGEYNNHRRQVEVTIKRKEETPGIFPMIIASVVCRRK